MSLLGLWGARFLGPVKKPSRVVLSFREFLVPLEIFRLSVHAL